MGDGWELGCRNQCMGKNNVLIKAPQLPVLYKKCLSQINEFSVEYVNIWSDHKLIIPWFITLGDKTCKIQLVRFQLLLNTERTEDNKVKMTYLHICLKLSVLHLSGNLRFINKVLVLFVLILLEHLQLSQILFSANRKNNNH